MSEGHEPSDWIILTGAGGGIRMFANSEWSLPALQAEHGAAAAYRVRTQCGVVTVEAHSPSSSVRLEAGSPARAARMLAGTTVLRDADRYSVEPRATAMLTQSENCV